MHASIHPFILFTVFNISFNFYCRLSEIYSIYKKKQQLKNTLTKDMATNNFLPYVLFLLKVVTAHVRKYSVFHFML